MSTTYTSKRKPWLVGKSLLSVLAIAFTSVLVVIGGVHVQPANAAEMNGFAQVSTGTYFTCAVKGDGSVWCWGRNNVGQLGNGTTTNASRPVQVTGLTNATLVTSGDTASCAMKSDGTVWCWGGGSWGQLGNGATTNANTPVQVSNLTTATQISGKYGHFCALKADASVVCWGWNVTEQLGDSTTTDRSVPTAPNPALPMGATHLCAGIFVSIVFFKVGWVGSWGGGNNCEL